MSPEALTFTTCATGLMSIYAMFRVIRDTVFRDSRRINDRVQEMVDEDAESIAGQSSLFKRLNGNLGEDDAQLDLATKLQIAVEQTGLPITVRQFFWIATMTATLGAFVGIVATSHWIVALAAGALGFVIPFGIVRYKQQKRQHHLADQLPEAFELMSRVVRAGQTMSAAMQLVAAETKPPISEEFRHCVEQQNLGLSQEVTLREMARRNNIMELQMFSVAVLMQRQTGGSPIELLNNLSYLVRQRIRLKGKVRALTSEGRMQAVVLTFLPLVAFAAIYFLKRDYAEILLDRPWLLASMAGASVLGSLWIRKIINFKY